MHEQDKAILKSLVSVAWADGHIAPEENEVLEALLQAFEAKPEEIDEIRLFASTPRSLDDIPLTELSASDRRLLFQHAVLLTFIDGEQAAEEKKLLTDLGEKLRIAPEELEGLLAASTTRAKRFLDVL